MSVSPISSSPPPVFQQPTTQHTPSPQNATNSTTTKATEVPAPDQTNATSNQTPKQNQLPPPPGTGLTVNQLA
jgi:hypothetical protein